ncbi:3-hydroxyacyl-CoA dehydrogenase [Dyadobacter sp. OTU695]|uniref:3-hydroxyacyl-CoA dehydrogenase n=1 Tax=Dyadobacter sp. OTU695 TaxID=3043860 RepID=UPI00313D1B1B
MKKITIAGSGVLGSQIAFQTAFFGYDVTVYDINDVILEKARASFARYGDIYLNDVQATRIEVEAANAHLRLSSDLKVALEDADLLIEAIPERVDIKRDFYQRVATLAPDKTIFATNTSTLLPSQFAAETGRPEKFLALHFANEIWFRNTAEIMGHPGTSRETFDAVVAFAKSIGMVALPLHKEQPGYITNSLIVPWVTAALKLWAGDVADYETIDKTWIIATKSNFAPFVFADIAGLNTAFNITSILATEMNDPQLRQAAKRLKEEYIDKGKLGIASGEGFYKYPDPAFEREDFLKYR